MFSPQSEARAELRPLVLRETALAQELAGRQVRVLRQIDQEGLFVHLEEQEGLLLEQEQECL